jgi:hypothetical protein
MPSKHLSCIAGLFCTYDTLLDCLHGNLHGNSCVHKKMLLVEDCRSLFVSLLYRFFLLFCLFDFLRLHSFPFPCIAFFPIYASNLFDEMTFRIFLSISICSIFHSNIFTHSNPKAPIHLNLTLTQKRKPSLILSAVNGTTNCEKIQVRIQKGQSGLISPKELPNCTVGWVLFFLFSLSHTLLYEGPQRSYRFNNQKKRLMPFSHQASKGNFPPSHTRVKRKNK